MVIFTIRISLRYQWDKAAFWPLSKCFVKLDLYHMCLIPTKVPTKCPLKIAQESTFGLSLVNGMGDLGSVNYARPSRRRITTKVFMNRTWTIRNASSPGLPLDERVSVLYAEKMQVNASFFFHYCFC